MAKKKTRKEADDMTLLEHLDELRVRFRAAIIALLIGTIISAIITRPVVEFLVAPAKEAGIIIQVLKPTEALASYFKISLLMGVVLAMPVILFEVFEFARPGLESREKLYIIIGVPFASLSFAGGAAFAGLVAIPRALPFLSNILRDVVQHNYSFEEYLSFISSIMLSSGLVFETPLVMFFLSKLGIIDARGYIKAWRFVVIGAAIAAALITPTVDILNMMLIMGPFLLLYGLGIFLSWLAGRQAESA